jgi:type I restriction enzyme, R subunit
LTTFTESAVEDAALSWFGELGFSVLAGPEITPGELLAERDNFSDVILASRQVNCSWKAEENSLAETET